MGLSDDRFDLPPMPGSFPRNAVAISRLARPAFDAPIWRLPIEMLADVFVQCLEPKFILPNIMEAPLLLCRVCSIWRRVAISTPLLWTSMDIQLPPKTSLRSLHFGVESWLARSGALPLAICIESRQPLPGEFFDVFTPSFNRWRDVKLDIPKASLPYLFKHSSFPAQMTHLSLSYDPSINDCLDILSRCPRLQEAFFASLLDSSDPVTRPLIILPDLHTLRVVTLHDTLSLLGNLQLPRLRKLEIQFYFRQSRETHRLFSVLLRSHSPIESLHLGGLAIPAEDLPHCDQRVASSLKLIVSDPSTREVRDIPISRRSQVRAG